MRGIIERLLLPGGTPFHGGFWSPGHASLCNNSPFPVSYLESLESHLFTKGRNTSPPGAVGQLQGDDNHCYLEAAPGPIAAPQFGGVGPPWAGVFS